MATIISARIDCEANANENRCYEHAPMHTAWLLKCFLWMTLTVVYKCEPDGLRGAIESRTINSKKNSASVECDCARKLNWISNEPKMHESSEQCGNTCSCLRCRNLFKTHADALKFMATTFDIVEMECFEHSIRQRRQCLRQSNTKCWCRRIVGFSQEPILCIVILVMSYARNSITKFIRRLWIGASTVRSEWISTEQVVPSYADNRTNLILSSLCDLIYERSIYAVRR